MSRPSGVLRNCIPTSASVPLPTISWLWVVAILFCLPVREWCYGRLVRYAGEDSGLTKNVVFLSRTVLTLSIMVLSVALLIGETSNPFIYTRF